MKRIITDIAIFEGEAIPQFYGIAYRDIAMRKAICYPIPLNWLVRLGRELYFALINPEMSGLEKMLNEARQEGFKVGADFTKYEIDAAYERGAQDILNRIDAKISEFYKGA